MSEYINLPTTDGEGETVGRLSVAPSAWVDGGTFVELTRSGRRNIGHLSAEEAARLGAFLVKRYGLDGWTAEVGEPVGFKAGTWPARDATRGTVEAAPDGDGAYRITFTEGPRAGGTHYVYRGCVVPLAVVEAAEARKPAEVKTETAPAPRIVEGGVYRLLPNAETAPGIGSQAARDGVTRVKVVDLTPYPNSGAVRAVPLDGEGVGRAERRYLILPKYLAPLPADAEASPAPLTRGDRAVVTEDFKANYRQFRAGDVVEVYTVGSTLAGVRRLSDGATCASRLDRLRRTDSPAPALAPLTPGDIVALKPRAKTSTGGNVYFRPDVTRVRVVRAISDSDFVVRSVDGSGVDGGGKRAAFGTQYVGRAFLGDPETVEPVAPTALKPGDIVALKPRAKTSHGHEVYFLSDVTRVRVEAGPDPDGDYRVCNVDGAGTAFGRGTYRTQYVGRAFLGDPEAAPGEESRPWAVGDVAVVTDADAFGRFRFRVGERVRLVIDKGRRDGSARHAYWATSVDGRHTGMVYAVVLRREAAPAAWAVGDEAIITEDFPHCASLYAGDRVRVTSIGDRSDNIRAEFVSGRGERFSLAGGWYLSTGVIRRP
ncbi:hypothetical protein [Micromonospora okii]|uniref:hypothetical protein n=1 Tax=Micromonospora okii TaxID=1182970 RepID=UPI001E2CA332|nr:hypothetical protein [Micromonospora okii]